MISLENLHLLTFSTASNVSVLYRSDHTFYVKVNGSWFETMPFTQMEH
jgi:hypothetical protein